MWTSGRRIGKMKGKNMFLGSLLVFSGLAVGLIGIVIRFVVLEPLGLSLQGPVISLPFVLLRDDALRYVITDLRQSKQPTEEIQLSLPAQEEPTDFTESIFPQRDPMENALLIGDSRTCGLRDHARLEGADYFCQVGMSVFTVANEELSDLGFQKRTLATLLAEREYSCVVINLGLNEAGYPLESFLHAYRELVNMVVKTQPQAVIVLHGVLAVSRRWETLTPYAAPEKLRQINGGIQSMAEEFHVHYLDANVEFVDEYGYLPDELTADGCHFYAKYTRHWADWICHTIRTLYR
jgi:lysophospholipase L1-like esterase